MDREDPAMDNPETRKEVAHEDRADPDTGGGFYLGKNAVDLLRRALWGAAGVAFVGLVLAGTALWRFWNVPDFLKAIEQVLRSQ